MHKTLSPFLAIFDRPLDARFRQDVSSLHAPNIPPVRIKGHLISKNYFRYLITYYLDYLYKLKTY